MVVIKTNFSAFKCTHKLHYVHSKIFLNFILCNKLLLQGKNLLCTSQSSMHKHRTNKGRVDSLKLFFKYVNDSQVVGRVSSQQHTVLKLKVNFLN